MSSICLTLLCNLTAASADAGTPAGTVVLRAAGLRVHGGTVTAAGDVAPAAGELAVSAARW